MNTTISFDYAKAKEYANELFTSTKNEKVSYQLAKRAEAIMILIGVDTGLRISDLLKLKFEYINTDNEYGYPEITTRISKVDKIQTKPLSSNTLRLIEAFNNWVLSEYGYTKDYIFFNYESKSKKPGDENKLFTRQWAHKRLNIANDNSKLGKKVDVAGAHSLRRTAGKYIYDRTKDLRLAQDLLGHKRMKQSETYLKLSESDAKEKYARLHN